MVSEENKVYIQIIGIITGVIVSLVLFLIYKRLFRKSSENKIKKNRVQVNKVEDNRVQVNKVQENKVEEDKIKENKLVFLRKHNPGIDDETLKLLIRSFYTILTGYSSVEGSVILDGLNKNVKGQDRNDWFDKVWKLNFVQKEKEKLLELNEMEKFLIDNNEFLIEEILCRNGFNLEPLTMVKMVEKKHKNYGFKKNFCVSHGNNVL